jgi:hypothetical protein
MIALLVAILATFVFVLGALFGNGSFSPANAMVSSTSMVLAAVVTSAAIFACTMALTELNIFCRCAAPACVEPCGNLRTWLVITLGALVPQLAACLAAAIKALVPFLGVLPIWIILGTLLTLVVTTTAGFTLLSKLNTCQPSP